MLRLPFFPLPSFRVAVSQATNSFLGLLTTFVRIDLEREHILNSQGTRHLKPSRNGDPRPRRTHRILLLSSRG